MPRKNIKIPEALFESLREDKPEDVTWPDYLEARCLTEREHNPVRSGALPGPVREQLDRIEDAATTAEDRTGNIERTLEELGR